MLHKKTKNMPGIKKYIQALIKEECIYGYMHKASSHGTHLP